MGQRTDRVLRTRLCCCRGEQVLRGGRRVGRRPPAEGAQEDFWKDDLHHFLQGRDTGLLYLQSMSQNTGSPGLECWQGAASELKGLQKDDVWAWYSP